MSIIHSRYEVGHALEGLIGTAMTLAEAKTIAGNWASGNTGYVNAAQEVRILDTMARCGQPETWAMAGGKLGQWVPMRYKSRIK